MYDRTEVGHNEVESCVVADDLLACEETAGRISSVAAS